MFDAAVQGKIKEEFSHLEDVVYLNSGLTSVPPQCVQRAYRDEMERFITSYGSEAMWEEEQNAARAGFARLIGALPEEVAFVKNTTEGIGIISMGYPWQPDKNIVLYGKEHPSNLFDWILRKDEGKLKINFVEASAGGLKAADIIAAIDENTQAVAVSAVQYLDGAFVDLKAIGSVCRERNILFIVDGIQAAGRLNVQVKELGIDFLSCGGHKGLLARTGIGFVYCRKELIGKIIPPNGSYQSNSAPTRAYAPYHEDKIHWWDTALRFENGNHNHPGVCALIASTGLINELGIQNIHQHITGLQEHLMTLLAEKAEQVLPRSDHYSGIINIPFPREQRRQVAALLEKNRVIGTLRGDNLRLCISFFNTMEHMAVAAQTIEGILDLS